MIETHEEYNNLFRDEDMMEYGPNTKYISSPSRIPMAKDERVLAEYDQGEWRIEAQVLVDGEWYVASRDVLSNPPEGEDEWCFRGKVETSYGAFTGLSTLQRILLSPLYTVWFAWLCVTGEDVNLQVINTEQ